LHTPWALSLRWIDTDVERAHWRATGTYRFLPSLSAGLEWNVEAKEVAPIATWFFLREDRWKPAAFLGTSSDRIGSPEGTRATFLTVAKNLDPVPASVYASVNYSEWDAGWNVPFGANIEVVPRVTIQPMYDGERTHLLATWSGDRFAVTAIWAWMKDPGLAISAGF
jgi:hypothetical protein